jgi:hypothetical protein
MPFAREILATAQITFIRDTGNPSSTRKTFSRSLAQRRISIHLMSK